MNRTRRRTRGNKRRNKKTFKQKIYNMKGCSKSQRMNRSRMQYISKTKGQSKGRGFGQGRGIGFRGGRKLNGGSGSNHLIGAPWSVDQTVNSNYYANNLYDGKDVQTQMQLNGGSRRRRNKRRRLKGGGITDFVPSGITNLGRDLMYNSSSAYSSLVGADQPVNPSVTQGQLTSSIAANRVMI
jgi:hypothetical protein